MITVRQNNLLSKSKLMGSLSHFVPSRGQNPYLNKGELSKTILGSKKTPQPAIRIPIFFALTF